MSLFLVPESSVTDVQDLASRDVGGLRSNLGRQLVDDSCVGEGSASHNLVVASPSAVGVEVDLLDTLFSEIPGSRRVLGNAAGGGNMISGDRITEGAETVGVVDVLKFGEFELSALEERRVVNISRGIFPTILQRRLSLKSIPSFSTL